MLAPAFSDPVLASQKVFRAVMNASAHPGEVVRLPKAVPCPAPLTAAAGAVALTLLDFETPVWLDPTLADAAEVAPWLRFHTGAPIVSERDQAAFAFVADTERVADFAQFALGSADYPDRSTTLVLQVERFGTGTPLTLSGPGIDGTRPFAAAPLPADFAARLRANRALFPRGVDLLLVSEDAIAALPRSVRPRQRG
jgi:alpha-D-ribose 1-methylphosphonate 5-triphosphate synthase subunit PhnH